MTEQKPIHNPKIQEYEIDLMVLAKTSWKGRNTIIKITLFFFAIGLFVAVFSTKQYSVTTVMVPQVNDRGNSLGGLSSLAAMAGFKLDMSSGSGLNPSIYPKIVNSIPFQKELMYTMLNFEGYKEKISLFDYYSDPYYSKFNMFNFLKKYTIGLPSTILKAIRRKDNEIDSRIKFENKFVELTTQEKDLTKLLDEIVYLNLELKEGYVTLTTIMPEALSAAQLAQKAQILLQDYITEFKIEKAKAKLSFIEALCLDKKELFEQTQKKLAIFRDQNKNVSTALARTEEEWLLSEYQIAQSVYNELAKQLENSRIQVKEETPVFSIIEPIIVPSDSFKPNRKRILIIWIFFGMIAGAGWVFSKFFLVTLIKEWGAFDSQK